MNHQFQPNLVMYYTSCKNGWPNSIMKRFTKNHLHYKEATHYRKDTTKREDAQGIA